MYFSSSLTGGVFLVVNYSAVSGVDALVRGQCVGSRIGCTLAWGRRHHACWVCMTLLVQYQCCFVGSWYDLNEVMYELERSVLERVSEDQRRDSKRLKV